MESVVIDTNVLISGMLKQDSPPRAILDLARQGRFSLITSEPLIDEFQRVADKLTTKYPLIARQREAIQYFLSIHSIGNPPHFNPAVVKQDPEDDRILECALAGHASYIVSGNKHLTGLGQFHGMRILPPAAFLQRILVILL